MNICDLKNSDKNYDDVKIVQKKAFFKIRNMFNDAIINCSWVIRRSGIVGNGN